MTINPRNVASKSRFSCILTSASTLILILLLTLTWVLSLRPIRLKIGDYYFKEGQFDQAANWYEKVVRKEKFKIDEDRSDRLLYKQDLSKLKSALIPVMEGTLLKVSQLLSFGESKDLKSLLTDPKFFLKNIDELPGSEPKEKLQKAKKEVLNFDYIYNNFKSAYEKNPDNMGLDYLISTEYFFKGLIDETENNFMSADSNYEKTINSSSKFLSQINERRKKILSKVADEYFLRSPFIKKVGNANVILQSESPLVVIGIVPGVDNYLLYETCPVKIIIQKYTSPRLRIRGEVRGGNGESCIVPRVIFWGTKGYVGETGIKYFVKGKFDIKFQFSIPGEATGIGPMITFDGSCFSEEKKIVVEEVKWS